ncbi:MAG TPA: hypothetical protein VND62_07435 [Acidimicrobiales bacterium]|nr:hypothetical protein [Acidimicrobiales bacterium]
MEVTEDGLERFFEAVLPHMNEVQRRVAAGATSEALGRGGKTAVPGASRMSRNTVVPGQRRSPTLSHPPATVGHRGNHPAEEAGSHDP